MKKDFRKTALVAAMIIAAGVAGCGGKSQNTQNVPQYTGPLVITATPTPKPTATSKPTSTPRPTYTPTPKPGENIPKTILTEEPKNMSTTDFEALFRNIKLSKIIKPLINSNPLMVQRFGADPYAMVYDGRVYIYMTGDNPMYDSQGKIKENNYSNIYTINVISSADLVNWTDHGTVYAASAKGQAKWGINSWAPAAAWKNIDGKDKFFLYFANGGNGIAVLTGDTPYGPFTDPLGRALISRSTPTCGEVTWLFDPAVLMDDDGQAYIYFGGGIPNGKEENPGTARVAKLADNMISLDGDPIRIENVPYLFEDSGINKINGTYYYSYCSNFSMSQEGKRKYGFDQGQIIVMKSDDPMGPFELCGPVLKNPGNHFGRGGNNHHCMFEFKGEWYITYHARLLEEALGLDGMYRSTNIDVLKLSADGMPVMSTGTRNGVMAVDTLDPYKETEAVTLANASGIETVQYGEEAVKYGSGQMILTGIHDGSFTGVFNVDFGEGSAKEIVMKVKGRGKGVVKAVLDAPGNDAIAYIPVSAPGEDFTEVSATLLNAPSGIHKLFFVYAGEDFDVLSWQFK